MDEPLPRFDGAAAWATLPAEHQAEIGAIALELIAADFASVSGEGNFVIERAAYAAGERLHLELAAAVMLSLPDNFGDHAGPAIPSRLGVVCRSCGCSEDDACAGGCAWAQDNLCTACVEPAEPEPHEGDSRD